MKTTILIEKPIDSVAYILITSSNTTKTTLDNRVENPVTKWQGFCFVFFIFEFLVLFFNDISADTVFLNYK